VNEGTERSAATLANYLRVVRRRKWIVVVALAIVPAVAYYLGSRQHLVYRASAQVVLGGQIVPTSASGAQPSLGASSPLLETTLARVPAVARLAVARLDAPIGVGAFLGATSVSISSDGSIVTFNATAADPVFAQKLANAYSAAYIKYRYTSQTAGLEAARRSLEKRLPQAPTGPVHDSLVFALQSLNELDALRLSNARVLQAAGPGGAIPLQTKRDTAIGVALGLVLGLGLAFLFEALDTRVRSAEVVAERLALPLLARLPAPSRRLSRKHRLAMLDKPDGLQAEAFRVLRTNLEFATLGQDIRTIMVTSAVEQEGKSTTIANLAVAFARLGRPVTLVDLDLRRPFIDRFFDLEGRPGLTDVALGRATLEEALVPVLVGADIPMSYAKATNGDGHAAESSNGSTPAAALPGILHVLKLGPVPPDPGDFISRQPLLEILEALRARPGLILIDAPPLLHIGDGLVLGGKIDAVMVVVRMSRARRAMLGELSRLLDRMPSHKLGFVATDAHVDEGYGYGYGYGSSAYRPYQRAPEEPARK
jgi:Mrp family chromosome partitioning ATPase